MDEPRNRMAKRRGRPTFSEAQAQPPPRPVEFDEGKIRCTACGACRLKVYATKADVRYCRCEGCGARHAITGAMMRRVAP